MTSRAKMAFWIAALISITIVIAQVVSRANARRRQAAYQSAVAGYAHDLRPGEPRSDVEQYILAHGAHAESDSQPDSPNSRDLLVRLGEETPRFGCSYKVVYLQLKFDANDKYAGNSLKTEEQDCM
jgi:hypothetical protein